MLTPLGLAYLQPIKKVSSIMPSRGAGPALQRAAANEGLRRFLKMDFPQIHSHLPLNSRSLLLSERLSNHLFIHSSISSINKYCRAPTAKETLLGTKQLIGQLPVISGEELIGSKPQQQKA